MNSHFFTAPFYFAFIWFRVQGSGLWWRLRRNIYGAMPESRLIAGFPRIISLPLEGEGTPKGRIGHRQYERQRKKAERCAIHVRKA